MPIHPIMRRSGLVVVAVVGAACSDSVEPVVVLPPSGPVDREELIGTYDAAEMSATTPGGVVDILAAGGSMTLTLETTAQYTAQVTVPGLGAGGSDISATIEGTWTYDPLTGRVRFPVGSGFLSFFLVPSRAEDPSVILLTGTIPEGEFVGAPAIDVVLQAR